MQLLSLVSWKGLNCSGLAVTALGRVTILEVDEVSISRKSQMSHIWILLHPSECYSARATRLDISSECHLTSLLQPPRNTIARLDISVYVLSLSINAKSNSNMEVA